MKKIAFLTIILFCSIVNVFAQNNAGAVQRDYLVKTMIKIAEPVFTSLSNNELKKKMPVEGKLADRPKYTYLEAFGRMLAGMAPWLELEPDNTPEGKLRAKYIALARKCLHNATNPGGADFMNFNDGGQPLVDAAFLAQGLLRAPGQLWEPLSNQTKQNIISALKSTRVITPGQSNWLLFSATVEAALLKFDGQYDRMRMDYAINMHQLWYKGDGAYGDGPNYHWDYYNSFVIQPMLVEVMETLKEKDKSRRIDSLYNLFVKRAVRYAVVQERFISPEGTYPPIGRSLAYRFGAFQNLSKIALMQLLPQDMKPQQVRAALYTVIKRQIEAPGTFDKNGWLQIGMTGHQPGIGERYISTGSLYLCSQAFLFLGLPATNELWNGKDEDWTAQKIWKGVDVGVDHAED